MKSCNIEVFCRNGLRKSFLKIPRAEIEKIYTDYCADENVMLILVAYKMYNGKIFHASCLDMRTRTPENDFVDEHRETNIECDDPVYLFTQQMIYDRIGADGLWPDSTSEYLSPSNRAALE